MAPNLTEWHIAFARLKTRCTLQPHSTPETPQGGRRCPHTGWCAVCPHVGREDEHCPCVDDDNWNGEPR